MKYTYWTEKEIFLLKKFYPKLRIKELIEMFPNRTKKTISIKALSMKLPSAKLWQKRENEVLYKNFREMPLEKIKRFLPKRSKLAILAHGERLGLKRKIDKPKLKINESYFKKWSTNMAYILGFIFADGNITEVINNGHSDKLGFGINKKDIDILKKIKKEISAKQALSISGKYVHFSIFSQIIVDDLKKLGITYRKSSLKSPCELPKIPQRYIKDFIRGIVDGDGSIHFDKKGYPTLNICGRKEIMTFIKDHFLLNFRIYSKITQPKKNGELVNVFFISYRCNSAKILIKYLYKNATIYLKRKFKLSKRSARKVMKYRKNYTEEEKKIIQKFYSCLTKDELLPILPNRAWYSIQSQASKLKVYKYNINSN